MPERDAPTIIGIRHHSPACARWVKQCIEEVRPKYVLIEGPANFNSRIDELLLPHTLPIALYEYCQFASSDMRSSRAWVPFTDWSPEWQALQAAHREQAEIRFIDLPVWAQFGEQDESDEQHAAAYEKALLQATGMENIDALWDHLFEDETQASHLPQALSEYFQKLRHTQPGSDRDQQREAHMAQWIAWAMAQQQGPVVVVCGGWHAPVLAEQWRKAPSDTPPALPDLPEGNVETGSYLMPYSEKRLDVLSGYLSGMPATIWQRWCWESGQQQAGEQLLHAVMSALRKKRQPASTADLGAAHVHALALAQLRGHTTPLRSDWLDALAGSLIKEALDEPLPWSYRGELHAGTNPILVALIDCLAGQRIGTLAADTPQPPLPGDVAKELARTGITLPSTISLNRFDAQGLQQSQVLHRLKILEIPGIRCQQSSASVLSGDGEEQWKLQSMLHQHAALIEAARYGASLEEAARQHLTAELASTSSLAGMARLLNEAALAGLSQFSQDLLDRLAQQISHENHFEGMGEAIEVLYNLWRYGDEHDDIIQATLQAALDRVFWLVESTNSVDKGLFNAHLHCWKVLCHILRDQQSFDLKASPSLALIHLPRALAVIERRTQATAAQPLIRGAALGTLIRLEHPFATEETALALLATCTPLQLGEALQGLIALARHQLTSHSAFVNGFSQQLERLDGTDFIQALPDLRAAFAWLPPQERSLLAQQVLAYYQLPLHATQLIQAMPTSSPEMLARHRQQEQHAMQRLRSWGVL